MGMYSSPIVPAIIPQSQTDATLQLQKIAGLPEVHIDVSDGIFVPAISWPYRGEGEASNPKAIKSLLDVFSLEVDLMVSDPLRAAEAWLQAGADLLVFHAETISLTSFAEYIKTTNLTIGISALNSTPYTFLKPYLEIAEYVQVMGIARIGQQGQPFDDEVYERIANIRSDFPNLPISIDGAVNLITLPLLRQYQLTRYIVGSAIMLQADPVQSYQELALLVA